MNQTIAALMRDISAFSELSEEEVKIVSDYIDIIEVNAGAIIFSEGAPGEFACFIADGILDITKKSLTGTETGIATLSRGDSIGEMSLVDHLNRSATVRARTPATLLMLPKEKFDTLLEVTPSGGIAILKGLARTLSLHLRRTSSDLAHTSWAKEVEQAIIGDDAGRSC